MSGVKLDEFRCKVCGGTLEADRGELGVAKCSYCGNKFSMPFADLRQLKQVQKPQETNLFVSMTKQDVQKEAKARKQRNAVYAIKALISLMCMGMVGAYVAIMTFMLKGNLSLGVLETIIVSAVGLVIPGILTTFSKVYKFKDESLFLTTLSFLVTTVIFAVAIYLSYTRYFVLLMN